MPNPLSKGLNLSFKELKLLAKNRGIKGYKSMSEDDLLSTLKASELLKERIKEIRKKLKELKLKFSKSEKNEIRKNIYEIENGRNLFASKKIEECLLKLEENLSKSKKYYDYDDYEYKGIKSMRNLPIDKDYKPITIDGTFNNNYV